MFDPNLVQNNFFYQYGGSTCQLLRQPAAGLSPQYEHTLLDYQCLYPILNQRASRQHRVTSIIHSKNIIHNLVKKKIHPPKKRRGEDIFLGGTENGMK